MNYSFLPDDQRLYITQYFTSYCAGICLDFSLIPEDDVDKLIDYLQKRKEEYGRKDNNLPELQKNV